MPVTAIDHIQLAMPAGGEAAARRFFGDLLGMPELPKPAALQARGGLWFQCGAIQLHLGIDPDFQPALNAHPGLIVDALAPLGVKDIQMPATPHRVWQTIQAAKA